MSEHRLVTAPAERAGRCAIGCMLALLLALSCPGAAGEVAAAAASPAAGPVAAPIPHLAVDLSASPAAVAVGDAVTVTLTYRWPHGWTVLTPSHEPEPSGAFASEFVTSVPPAQASSTGEEQRRTFTLTLLALHSGTWQLPRPGLDVEGPMGHRHVSANAVIVQVGIEAKPADLPAIRGAWVHPPSTGSGPMAWWIIPLAIVLLVVALGLAYWWTRRHLVPPPTPLEVFTEECLAAISTSDGKEAGARLSLALRRYVGALYAFDGPGSTTRETATHLRGRLNEDEQHALLRLLGQLDDLRWSAPDLPAPLVRESAQSARTWCDQLQHRLDEAALAQERARAQPRRDPAISTRTAKGLP
jgi:hypothetical protein